MDVTRCQFPFLVIWSTKNGVEALQVDDPRHAERRLTHIAWLVRVLLWPQIKILISNQLNFPPEMTLAIETVRINHFHSKAFIDPELS